MRYSVRLIYPRLKTVRYPTSTLSYVYIPTDLTDNPFSFRTYLVTRTGWDMDPFVVISFGKKVFRTRVIRHSLNPTWDEKLLIHMRAYESAFKVQLTVLDGDKLSSKDHVGDAGFMVADLIADAPQRDEGNGLYGEEADGGHVMKEFEVPLISANGKDAALWEAKHNPVITFR